MSDGASPAVPQSIPEEARVRFIDAPELRFAIGVLKKVFVFTLIALSAAGLHIIVVVLENYGVPSTITITLTIVEYAVLLVDILWFARVLVIELIDQTSGIFSANVWVKLLLVIFVFGVGVLVSPYVTAWGAALLASIGRHLPH
jgi:hypothetical protein